jgi:mRNA interferase MazF
MPYRRGDVVLVNFPNSNLTTYKKRPALVVQDEGIATDLPQRIVACITSNLLRTGRTRIAVHRQSETGQQMGLLTDSVIMLDNLATVQDRAIDRSIGWCPFMREVEETLKALFGIP